MLDLHGYQTTDVAVASTASLLAGLGLEENLTDLWPSLVHMHHNRLVGPALPPQEPHLLHLLHLLLRTERGLAVTP